MATIQLSEKYHNSFGEITKTGVWLIRGRSGSGRSFFVMQLAKELCKYEKVLYIPTDDTTSIDFRNRIQLFRIQDEKGRLRIMRPQGSGLVSIMRKVGSPNVIIIDSIERSGMNATQLCKFMKEFKNKLIILTSHADIFNISQITKMIYDMKISNIKKIYMENYIAKCEDSSLPCFDSWPEKPTLEIINK